MKINRKIQLVDIEIKKVESEILEILDTADGMLHDIFRHGLSYRSLPLETGLFYSKMEADFARYRLEIMSYNISEQKLAGEQVDDEEYQELLKETKESYQ